MAYMEDEDEYGNALEETKTYAASTAPSPSKEKPNTSRTRKDKSRRDSSSPANALTDSDSTVHPSSAVKRESKMKSREKERDRDREREKSSSSKKQVTVVRPSIPKQSKTVPNLQSSSFRRSHDESSYYGVSPDKGIIHPGDINNNAMFALFGIIGAAFVCLGIWFFF